MRNRNYIILIFILILLFFIPSFLSAKKIREKDLPEKYQEWLKLTRYIILPEEREVFMQLDNDRERDIFIETFWKQRDPTPGTPQNEYKEEHIKRFNEANIKFKRGSAREGWMTDMGKFYILLGPPVSIERFDMPQGIYPTQIWYYYGDTEKGLPPHFALVFFRKGGAGEYKLYNPIVDGPASLLVEGRFVNTTDYEELVEKINEFAPTLALVSLSMIPGDVPMGFQPSTQDAIILANILELPKREVNPAYATHFLNYKGIVSTEYMTNFVKSKSSVALLRDPILGLDFVHFTVAPETISIDYYEPRDQFFCNFTIDVSLRKGEDIIFQYSKNFPFYFSPNELDRIKSNGIAIEDTFPVIEGKYTLIVLLRNSVGKEFTIFEKEIGVPVGSEFPPILGPLVGYRLEEYDTSRHIPFKVLNRKLVVDPGNTFSPADSIALLYSLIDINKNLWQGGKVEVLIKGLKEDSPTIKRFSVELRNYPFNRIISIDHILPPKSLAPDYYDVTVTLFDDKGEKAGESSAHFIVSPEEHISHPIARAKAFTLSNSFLFYYMLADQYQKTNDFDRAEENYRKGYELRPNYTKGLVRYAHFMLERKKFDKALQLAEGLKPHENMRFDYHLIKGLAYAGRGEYAEAIISLSEGNKIYNSDTRLLNSLGYCYYKLGQKSEALQVLRSSLRLNPEQENIKKLVAEIEKSSG
ncbi:MAG: GWxTD domain-containing protein [Candidatus Aminicenantales bacterium]